MLVKMMDNSCVKSLIIFLAVAVFIDTAESIMCYQCNSTNSTRPFQCNEMLTNDNDMEPQSCDHVFGAEYCIKQIGRFEGGIGTKRFCSKAHMGNYCDYVKQPGDKLNYRTCIYTCTGDGCNPASNFTPMTLLAPASLLICWFVNSRR